MFAPFLKINPQTQGKTGRGESGHNTVERNGSNQFINETADQRTHPNTQPRQNTAAHRLRGGSQLPGGMLVDISHTAGLDQCKSSAAKNLK